ncbi:MAG: hypothetical protein NC184_00930 [Roseburia sp.]|nr:hypothetical protein [Roseburia sp.]
MNSMSNNRYLKERNGAHSRLTLNSFLFETAVEERVVGGEILLSAVRDILAILRFKVQLVGFKYLSRLAVMYLVDSDYAEDAALNKIAEYYRVDTEFVYNNIAFNISANTEFAVIAARLLNCDISSIQCSISAALEAIGAIFKIYYNYSVADEKECIELRSDAITYHEILS